MQIKDAVFDMKLLVQQYQHQILLLVMLNVTDIFKGKMVCEFKYVHGSMNEEAQCGEHGGRGEEPHGVVI